MNRETVLAQFAEYQQQMAAYNFIRFHISWDASTRAPKGSGAYRSKMLGILSGDHFAYCMKPVNISLLETVSQMSDIDPLLQKSAAKYLRETNKIRKIPQAEFVAHQQDLSLAATAWEEARKTNNYALFAPYLAKMIEYDKRAVEYRGVSGHPYNTLLDDYEAGMTIEKYDAFFNALRAELVPFAKSVHKDGRKIDDSPLYQFYPKAKQREFLLYLAGVLRYDLNRGSISQSAHPFTNGASRDDVRITARYLENYLPASVFLGMHEMGHAMHAQQIDPRLDATNLDFGGCGLGESQSRFYENYIGRSHAFWQRHFGKLQNLFPEQLANLNPESFWRLVNRSKPGLIRLDADELTYPMHIMVRYELEREIFSGDVDVRRLPQKWNDKMEEYLGVRPTTDSEGLLQDSHWSGGSFGYFPTYALGTAYGAQFYYTMIKTVDLEREIANDRMENVNAWLKENIHQYGGLLEPDELMNKVTGESFDPKYFIRYIKEKFSRIYF
ncbi:MAG TPA: carboxypeptidase M32 [Bacillota bacterium]|nr:carboxypeptidase M32 [Bacillota bacterium]